MENLDQVLLPDTLGILIDIDRTSIPNVSSMVRVLGSTSHLRRRPLKMNAPEELT